MVTAVGSTRESLVVVGWLGWTAVGGGGGGGTKDGGGGVSPMVLMGIQSDGYRVICDRWVVGGSVVIGGRRSEDYGVPLL